MSPNPPVNRLPISGEELSDDAVAAIFALLRARRRFDPGNYKDRCLRRRIAKRLRASGAGDVAGYLALLAGDDREVELLLEALSIQVSRFFRDREVFDRLAREVLPELCARLCAAGRPELRLWSAGCAEGEEAYSLALLVGVVAPPALPASILATDVSAAALEQARAGRYPLEHLSELPAPLRETCFDREAGGYRLAPRIRDLVEFRRHDLAADDYPPADLILCRNVLMYFSANQQTSILARFAAALPAGGVLVLGRTEILPPAGCALFQAEFPRERIFRRLPDSR